MNFLRKVKTMLSDDDAPDALAVEESDHEEITLTLQLSVPRTAPVIDQRPTHSLAGQLLVATPVIESGMFAKSVIFLFEHTADGAAGVIINQPTEWINYDTLIQGQKLDLPRDNTSRQLRVYSGGPVDRHRGFILHSSEYVKPFNLVRHGEITVTAANAIVNDIAAGAGPRHVQLITGFAGWDAGQLEREIEQNAWIHVPATEQLVFNTPDDLKWATVSRALGIPDMAFFSTAVGHA